MNDYFLWNQFLCGNDKAYATLYEKYVDVLFAYGMRFTPNRELVKDCIQDVFVKIYIHRKSLTKTDNVKLYLFVALKNILFDYFKKNIDHLENQQNGEEPVFDVEYPVEDQMIAREHAQEQTQMINRIMDTLTSRQKEAIYYRYVEGMNLEMICELMQMNYQSAQNLLQRSLKKLRTAITDKNTTLQFYIRKAKWIYSNQK